MLINHSQPCYSSQGSHIIFMNNFTGTHFYVGYVHVDQRLTFWRTTAARSHLAEPSPVFRRITRKMSCQKDYLVCFASY